MPAQVREKSLALLESQKEAQRSIYSANYILIEKQGGGSYKERVNTALLQIEDLLKKSGLLCAESQEFIMAELGNYRITNTVEAREQMQDWDAMESEEEENEQDDTEEHNFHYKKAQGYNHVTD